MTREEIIEKLNKKYKAHSTDLYDSYVTRHGEQGHRFTAYSNEAGTCIIAGSIVVRNDKFRITEITRDNREKKELTKEEIEKLLSKGYRKESYMEMAIESIFSQYQVVFGDRENHNAWDYFKPFELRSKEVDTYGTVISQGHYTAERYQYTGWKIKTLARTDNETIEYLTGGLQ
jgi:hypothetical protein